MNDLFRILTIILNGSLHDILVYKRQVYIFEISSNSKRRIETDVMKLLMSDHDVELVEDKMQEFHIKFHGPKDTPYEKGVWRLHVELPDNYPYKSPSIGSVSYTHLILNISKN